MSGGAGHVSAMISKLKTNKAVRKPRRNYFKADNIVRGEVKSNLNTRKATPEELEEVRNNMAQLKILQQKKTKITLLISILTSLLLGTSIVAFFHYF